MTDPADDTYSEGYHVLDLLAALAESWLLLLAVPLLAGLTALGATTLRSTVAEQTWATVTIEAPQTVAADVHTVAFLSKIEQVTGLSNTLGVTPAQATNELSGWISASADGAGRVTILLNPRDPNVVEPVMAAIADSVSEMAFSAPDRKLAENMLSDYRSALETASNDLADLRGALGLTDGASQAAIGSGWSDGYAALSGLHRAELEWRLAIRNLENQLQSLPDGTIVSPIRVETTSQRRDVAMPVVLSAVAGFVLAALIALLRDAWRRAAISSGTSEKVARIHHAFGRRVSKSVSNAKN